MSQVPFPALARRGQGAGVTDILDELRAWHRTVDGISTPTVEVEAELLRRAAREIESLRMHAEWLQADMMSAGLD